LPRHQCDGLAYIERAAAAESDHAIAAGLAVIRHAVIDVPAYRVGLNVGEDGIAQPYQGIYTVLDTGPEIRGREIDVYMWNCTEAKAFGSYILRNNPKARVAILYQNDDFGKDYVEGLKERFGGQAMERIVAIASYELLDPTVDSQIIALKASGADTLLIAASPKFAAQAIRKVFDIGWHPTRFVAQVSTSPAAVFSPAGSKIDQRDLSDCHGQ
jgi:3D (Asp-Asp-Asp) domain-containing protein